MKVKVLSTQHSEGTLYLTGSFRNVEDSIGKELIAAGLAVEAKQTAKEKIKEEEILNDDFIDELDDLIEIIKEKVEVKPISKVEIKTIPKEKNK